MLFGSTVLGTGMLVMVELTVELAVVGLVGVELETGEEFGVEEIAVVGVAVDEGAAPKETGTLSRPASPAEVLV